MNYNPLSYSGNDHQGSDNLEVVLGSLDSLNKGIENAPTTLLQLAGNSNNMLSIHQLSLIFPSGGGSNQFGGLPLFGGESNFFSKDSHPNIYCDTDSQVGRTDVNKLKLRDVNSMLLSIGDEGPGISCLYDEPLYFSGSGVHVPSDEVLRASFNHHNLADASHHHHLLDPHSSIQLNPNSDSLSALNDVVSGHSYNNYLLRSLQQSQDPSKPHHEDHHHSEAHHHHGSTFYQPVSSYWDPSTLSPNTGPVFFPENSSLLPLLSVGTSSCLSSLYCSGNDAALEQAAAAAAAALLPLENDLDDNGENAMSNASKVLSMNSHGIESLSLLSGMRDFQRILKPHDLSFSCNSTSGTTSVTSTTSPTTGPSTTDSHCNFDDFNNEMILSSVMNSNNNTQVSTLPTCNINQDMSPAFDFHNGEDLSPARRKRRPRGAKGNSADPNAPKKQRPAIRGRGRGRGKGRATGALGRDLPDGGHQGFSHINNMSLVNNSDGNNTSNGDPLNDGGTFESPSDTNFADSDQPGSYENPSGVSTVLSQQSDVDWSNDTAEQCNNNANNYSQESYSSDNTRTGTPYLSAFTPPRYPGVCFSAAKDVWRARITLNRRQYESQFSVKKFGFEEAMWQAVAWRTSKEALYNAAIERGQQLEPGAEFMST